MSAEVISVFLAFGAMTFGVIFAMWRGLNGRISRVEDDHATIARLDERTQQMQQDIQEIKEGLRNGRRTAGNC